MCEGGEKPEKTQGVPCQQERLKLAPSVNFLPDTQSWHQARTVGDSPLRDQEAKIKGGGLARPAGRQKAGAGDRLSRPVR